MVYSMTFPEQLLSLEYSIELEKGPYKICWFQYRWKSLIFLLIIKDSVAMIILLLDITKR